MPIFMNINFVTGESSDSIEIDSFSFGMVNSTTIGSASTGAGAGKVSFHEITVTKHNDTASPMLLNAGNTGLLLPAVQISFADGSKTPYLRYDLKNVLISSIHWSSGGDRPTESISLAFEQFEVSYENRQTGGVLTETIRTGGQFFYPTE